MRFYNNKIAGIPSFVFWDKVDYFYLSHVIKKETIYLFLNSKAKYAGKFKKLSRESVISTTCF